LLVLEANHDTHMLEEHPHRPYPLKQRVGGRHGHLSNEAARDFLQSVPDPLWKRVLLGHLSRDCNHPDRVRELFSNGACPCQTECLDPEQLIFPEIDLDRL
jgi:phosphoribosyl 1,2-cyclic phosphodiesterase